MPRFAANISTLFTEAPFLERIAMAKACGFAGVECQFPYDTPPVALGDKLAMAGLPLALFNAPPGDMAAGERGLAALAGRAGEFRDGLKRVLDYIEYTECQHVHVLAGIVPEDRQTAAVDILLDNLNYAGDLLAKEGATVMVENVNLPDYMVRTPAQAAEIVRALDHKNVRMQYDIFHAQTLEGGITTFIENNLDIIGHIQVAGVPGRNEPDALGELNWGYLFDLLDAHGYAGWIGAEYAPRTTTIEGLNWGRDWGIAPPAANDDMRKSRRPKR